MADAAISDLDPITLIQDNDLFVLEQNGEAMKLLGSLLKDYINRNILTITVQTLGPTEAAKVVSYNSTTGALTLGLPRGCGIANVQKTSTSGLTDTYTITFETPSGGTARPPITFPVKNGKGVTKIEKTSGTHAPGTLDTYTITYNDNTTSTFQVYNGQDGEGSPGSATPKMDGTAAAGTANAYSRQDHVHPTDSKITALQETVGTHGTQISSLQTAEGQTRDMISDAWAQRTWTAGEYCINDNKLWKCLVDNSSRPSEGANWKQVKLTEVLEEELIKVKTVRISYSITAYGQWNANPYLYLDVVDGYTQIGIVGHQTNYRDVIPIHLSTINGPYGLFLSNTSNEVRANELILQVLYLKNK